LLTLISGGPCIRARLSQAAEKVATLRCFG
jgi:hypothetical protein